MATASLPGSAAADEVAALGVDADLHGKSQVAGVILRDGRAGFVGARSFC